MFGYKKKLKKLQEKIDWYWCSMVQSRDTLMKVMQEKDKLEQERDDWRFKAEEYI